MMERRLHGQGGVTARDCPQRQARQAKGSARQINWQDEPETRVFDLAMTLMGDLAQVNRHTITFVPSRTGREI